MASLTTRAGKGSPLTNNELDANFNNLNAEVTPSRPTVRPSLLLDFAQTKQLDPRITFSRASTATYYDGKSVVKAEENLLTYSQDFDNSAWTKSGLSAVTANAVIAPDGTTTADKISEDSTATTYHFLSQSIAKPALALPYTFTLYAKAAERQFVHITIYDNVSVFNRFTFDLVNGTTGTASSVGGGGFSGLTTFITSVGNGWYRIGCSFTSSAASQLATHIHMTPSDSVGLYTGTAGSGIYVWGAQLEQRAYATAYTPTTSSAITNYIPALQTAASGTARFDHDPVTGESKGLLIEEQRTNLITYSQNISSPLWSFYSPMSLGSANAVIAPDGSQSASILTTTNAGSVYKDSSVSGTGTYAASIYVHTSSTCTSANLSFFFTGSSAQNVGVTFNPSTGAYISSGVGNGATNLSYSVTPAGNGWYRISVSGTGTNASNTTGRLQLYSNVSTQNTIVVWGAQLEAGAFATSYIPTPLTYTGRASTATYKAADGLIRIAGNDVARYEPNAAGGSNMLLEGAASNIFTYSDDLANGVWNPLRVNVASNSNLAPDGSLTADRLIETSVNDEHMIRRLITGLTSNGTYTVSAYVKSVNGRNFRIRVLDTNNVANGYQAEWAMANGTNVFTTAIGAGSVVSSSVTPVGGDWYRMTLTGSGGATCTAYTIDSYVISSGSSVYSGDNVSGIILWGMQLESGSAATSYIPSVETHTGRSSTATYYDSTGTIRTAASGQPRYTYNPSLLTAPPKLLLEAQATNYATASEDIANWPMVAGTGTSANVTAAPDGNATADKIIPGTSVNYYRVYRVITTTTGNPYVFSVFVKDAGYSAVRLEVSSAAVVDFNLSTASVVATQGSGYRASGVISLPNGWYRIWVAYAAGGTTAYNYIYGLPSTATSSNFAGDGTSGIYAWGGQIEDGYAPTSYIPTSGSAVTRAADTSTSAAGSRAADVYSSSQVTRSFDVATMTGTNFSSWFRQSEGALYSEATPNYQPTSLTWPRHVSISDGTNNNEYSLLSYAPNNSAGFAARANASAQADMAGAPSSAQTGQLVKVAGAYKTNDFATSANGAAASTDGQGSVATVDRMHIGSLIGYSQLNGTIKRIAYYPKRLSNAELQGLTS